MQYLYVLYFQLSGHFSLLVKAGIHGPPSPNWSKSFKILLVLVWFGPVLVLVRGFLGKGWFYLEFFPKEHFGALYLISNIPAGVANFVVDPIYDGKE